MDASVAPRGIVRTPSARPVVPPASSRSRCRFRIDYTGSGDWLRLSEFWLRPIRDAAGVVNELAGRLNLPRRCPSPVLSEVQNRLNAMVEIGFGYLSLDRPTRTPPGVRRSGLTSRPVSDQNSSTCFTYWMSRASGCTHATRSVWFCCSKNCGTSATRWSSSSTRPASFVRPTTWSTLARRGSTAAKLCSMARQRLGQGEGSLTAEYLHGRKKMDALPQRKVDEGSSATAPSQVYSKTTCTNWRWRFRLPVCLCHRCQWFGENDIDP